MKSDAMLWDAVAMVGEDLLMEAMEQPEKKRRKKSVWVIAAAVVVLLSCIGWAAKEWIFAPGYGIIPAYTDMGVNVYAAEERVQIGTFTLEGIVFTENNAEPEENTLTSGRLMLWLYCEEQEKLQQWPDLWVNGNPYTFLHYRMTQDGRIACYTYIPKTVPDFDYEKNEPIPLETIPYSGQGTVVTIQPVQGERPYAAEPDGEPVEVPLVPAESRKITQIRLDGDTYVSFLPLTENVTMANLHDPDPLSCMDGAWDISAKGNFRLYYTDGTESDLSGYLSIDNADARRVTGIVSDRYDQPVSAVQLQSLSVTLDYSMRTAEDTPKYAYTFSLMEVGETISCEERMWSGMGAELWLTSIGRTETGLTYTTELRNLTGDPLFAEADGLCLFYAGEGILRDGYSTDEQPLLQRGCNAEDGSLYAGRKITPKGVQYALRLETGDPVILVLSDLTYTRANADGTPLGTVELG